MKLENKLRSYYFTAIFSVFFALLGFVYNTWRMEVTEDNNNIRTAAFEVMIALAEFEQVIYAAHYDQDIVAGSPRLGWVKIGLAHDLSALIAPEVEQKIAMLITQWQKIWPHLAEQSENPDQLIAAIVEVRMQIKSKLKSLD